MKSYEYALQRVAGVAVFVCTYLAASSSAKAELTLVKTEMFEVFSDGRAGGFVSWVNGDGRPPPTIVVGTDDQGEPAVGSLWNILGGELESAEETELEDDPTLAAAGVQKQGTINSMRLRSGFIGNSLGFGVRAKVTDLVTATAYLQFWTFIESPNRNIAQPNPADLKQGYAMVDTPYGKLLAGRARALFSRGATDINYKYAHAYGVGFPAALDSTGPTRGMIGFGVMGSGWAGSVQYATPELAGFQLTAGIFDPVQNQAARFTRTKWARPEAELRYKLQFGSNGLVEAFVNGAYQKLYRTGYCDPNPAPDPDADPAVPARTPLCDVTAFGVGYGARFELGPARLGIAGHFGDGLGLNRALEVSTASTDLSDHLRSFDGYYLQSQVVLGDVDLFAGAGMVRIFLTEEDKRRRIEDPFNPGQTVPEYSLIKNQIGVNAGVVYHWGQHLHFDVDYFRAEFNWQLREQQVLHCLNGGMTVDW